MNQQESEQVRMRLTEKQQQVILSAFHRRDAQAKIYLFGSRVDDQKRGGDIDLLVESSMLRRQEMRQIRREIIDQIGEQKIDIVLPDATNENFVAQIQPKVLLH